MTNAHRQVLAGLPTRRRRLIEGHVPTYDVCGVPIAAVTAADAAEVIAGRAATGGAFQVHLCNAYTLSLVRKDENLATALLEADLNLADGTPVARLGRKHGVDAPVRGPGLVPAVAEAGVKYKLRHYFYGGAEGVADQVTAELRSRVPQLQVAGCETPPFHVITEEELCAVAARVQQSKASVVWVGIGTPHQDYLVRRLAPLIDCAVVPVGAAFDFLAGRVNEAPRFLHGTGMEWLYRFAKEPRRLWRRYVLGNPRFLAAALRDRQSSTRR
jgi:N-acetylglucosaminyldiphosphoundecaprenol N-acetyl-beta-D-mannosaminyltransferase